MPENTLTTTTPAGVSTTRPVPPSWASVAPLLERWRMALIPKQDLTWDLLTGYDSLLTMRVFDARSVPWSQVPQAIAALAAQCEADLERCTTAPEGAAGVPAARALELQL